MLKRDIPIIGFVYGLLLPALGFMVMYLWWGKALHNMAFGEFMATFRNDHKSFAKVLTMSLLINLIPFIYCNSKRYDYSMRGIVIATMLYALLIVLIMFVW